MVVDELERLEGGLYRGCACMHVWIVQVNKSGQWSNLGGEVFFMLHCTSMCLFLLAKLPLSNLDADLEEV